MITELLAAQRAGWSLDRAFYRDADIYELEEKLLFPRQWTVVGHVSELPQRGSYIQRSLFGQEIVVVNAGDEGYRAFHNVCTHRGSRICKEDGRSPLLVCPYHAWSFKLTGALQTTKDLPDDADPAELGLHPVPMHEMGGLIVCGLDEDVLPDIAPMKAALLPALQYHGLDRAKIAVRQSYPTYANWKLVLENFFECYHCRPSHPEYFRMNGHIAVSAISDPDRAAIWEDDVAQWRAKQDASAPHNQQLRVRGGIGEVHYSLYRQPIGLDRKTASRTGEPVAPVMGRMDGHDGGETAFHIGQLSFMGAYNDYAILFQFLPQGPEETDVIATWLVDADADLADIDTDAMTFMWDVTTRQDKMIIEENAAGVRSPAYRPGPYTKLEAQTSGFVSDYVDIMTNLVTPPPPTVVARAVA
ncbi:MAG: aromatic ring-hydroxylating dioxygenase subunit alpha [Sphingobium sp.]